MYLWGDLGGWCHLHLRNEGARPPGWKEAPCWSSWGLNWSASVALGYLNNFCHVYWGALRGSHGGFSAARLGPRVGPPELQSLAPSAQTILLAKYFFKGWRAAVRWVDGKDRHQPCFHVTDLTVFEGRQPPELAQYLRWRCLDTSAIRTDCFMLSNYVW